MANTYFQFKEFCVEQEQTSMKVCTDACILGAYASEENPERILDVGAGTGLLSLMLAQRYSCPIDAVEIEEKAYREALKNFSLSPWSEQIILHHCSIQEYIKYADQQYDLIICNPPFYPRTKNASNKATHSDSLPFSDLVKVMMRLLSEEGNGYILLPPKGSNSLESMIQNTPLQLNQKLLIKNSENQEPFRVITSFGFKDEKYSEASLVIRNEGKYTPQFCQLMKDYYLFL